MTVPSSFFSYGVSLLRNAADVMSGSFGSAVGSSATTAGSTTASLGLFCLGSAGFMSRSASPKLESWMVSLSAQPYARSTMSSSAWVARILLPRCSKCLASWTRSCAEIYR